MTLPGPSTFVPPPRKIPWLLRPALWLTGRITGKDPLPARMLAYSPKAAFGAGVFELSAATGDEDLEARTLAVARIVASLVCGCPFCLDMNAATWRRAGLTAAELRRLLEPGAELSSLGAREELAARYARALSSTPVMIDDSLLGALRAAFSAREVVILATTIAQVNYWSRFNEGLGIPSAGFFDERACAVPTPPREGVRRA